MVFISDQIMKQSGAICVAKIKKKGSHLSPPKFLYLQNTFPERALDQKEGMQLQCSKTWI